MNGRNPGVLPSKKAGYITTTTGNRAERRALAAEARGKVRPSNLSFRDAMRAAVRDRTAAASSQQETPA